MTLWWTSQDLQEAHRVPASKVEILEVLQPLPTPCPAHLIPDATGAAVFHDTYRNAIAHRAVFVAIESENRGRWTVKADTLPAGPHHAVAETVNDTIRAAMTRLVHRREVDLDACKGPVHYMMHGLRSEQRPANSPPHSMPPSTQTSHLSPAPFPPNPEAYAAVWSADSKRAVRREGGHEHRRDV